MKIGIDARMYSEAGIGRYIKNLLSNLLEIDTKNDFVIFLKEKDYHNFSSANLKVKKVLTNISLYSISEQIILPIFYYRENLDLLFVPHFNAPIFYFKKTIITIHDVIMHFGNSRKDTTKNLIEYLIKKLFYFVIFNLSLIKAKTIIVPSVTTKNLLEEVSHLNISNKIEVVYEGCDPFFLDLAPQDKSLLNSFNIKTPYILFVGSAYPHKNLKDLIIAFLQVTKKNPNISLVIAGKRDKFLLDLVVFSRGLGLQEKVIFPSNIEGFERLSDTAIKTLYQNCLFYVTPSKMEGFNLTPLEAMACNAPCLLSNIPCHKEIYLDFATFFNPNKVIDIENAILDFLKNYNEQQPNYKNLLSQYSWKKSATSIIEIFKESKNSIQS